LVKHLERIGKGHKQGDGYGRHNQWNDDSSQCPHRARTVDFCRFKNVVGDILNTGNKDDHHVADELPVAQNDQAPESVFGIYRYGNAESFAQKAVDEKLPDIAKHDAADKVGHEDHGAEHIGSPVAPCQKKGKEERRNVDDDHRHHGKQSGETQGIDKVRIREGADIVTETNP